MPGSSGRMARASRAHLLYACYLPVILVLSPCYSPLVFPCASLKRHWANGGGSLHLYLTVRACRPFILKPVLRSEPNSQRGEMGFSGHPSPYLSPHLMGRGCPKAG